MRIAKESRFCAFRKREMSSHQKPSRFSREEAQTKLGRRVRTVVAVDGVASGTLGSVMQLDEIEKNSFEVIVEWFVLIDGKHQHDWFSKEQYELCLIDEPETDLATNPTA
jgi:hypothetical protein